MTHSFFEKITFYYFDETDSTNDLANLLLKQNKAENGDVIVTKFQTKGKGQSGSNWFSERDKSVLISLICKEINIDISMLTTINMLVSLALSKTIKIYLQNENIKIKWPNDIYVNNKKISGILIESNIIGDTLKNIIIGIGINVNQDNFPDLLPLACSFYTISNKKFDTNEITGVLIDNLNKQLAEIKYFDLEKIKSEYESQLYGKDESKQFISNGKSFEGTIKGINKNGQLEVLVNNNLEIFNNKEIEFVRSSN
ncbi:MAG: biotin--[acetyl-CoA-carboxylase] ligase [Bacteroidetes bacterium]|nr:biotin--[acetyl-CoA-carboxylase] ligase [Bacteroidota bacterium]